MWTPWVASCAAALSILTSSARAQQVPPDWELLDQLRLDFAVPDAPAFTLLQVTPSTILRPTTVRELGIAVSDFLGSGTTITIPQAFAAEFSPGLLIGGPDLTVSRYARTPWLYRLRVSAATQRATGTAKPSQVALGLRIGIIDGADLRTHPAYRQRQTRFATEINDLMAAVRRRLGPMEGQPIAVDDLSAEERQRLEALMNGIREGWEDKQWNATTLDLAVGMRLSGNDTTARDLGVDRYAAWLTLGTGFGTWGQLLVGTQAGAQRDTLTGDFDAYGSSAARLYVGTNNYKLFVEAQGSFTQDESARWLVNSGGEARFPLGGWITFSAGLEFDGDETGLVTNFSVKFGLPGVGDG